MSATIIKQKLSGLITVCGHTLNACSALAHATNTCNPDSIIQACQRFISCMAQTDQYVDLVYTDSNRELPIFLADFNKKLKLFQKQNKDTMKEVYSIIALAMKLKVLNSMAGMGNQKFFKLRIDTSPTQSKLKSKSGAVNDYRGRISTLQLLAQKTNRKIIIKESNFK